MKIRVFAMFEDNHDAAYVTINGVEVEFTRDTAQQDFECAAVSEKSLKVEENSISEFVMINSDEIQSQQVLTDTPVSATVTTPAE